MLIVRKRMLSFTNKPLQQIHKLAPRRNIIHIKLQRKLEPLTQNQPLPAHGNTSGTEAEKHISVYLLIVFEGGNYFVNAHPVLNRELWPKPFTVLHHDSKKCHIL